MENADCSVLLGKDLDFLRQSTLATKHPGKFSWSLSWNVKSSIMLKNYVVRRAKLWLASFPTTKCCRILITQPLLGVTKPINLSKSKCQNHWYHYGIMSSKKPYHTQAPKRRFVPSIHTNKMRFTNLPGHVVQGVEQLIPLARFQTWLCTSIWKNDQHFVSKMRRENII